MRSTTLGTFGPEVGVVGLGAVGMTFAYDMATPRDEATSLSVIHQALDLGMTLIGTADVYGPYTNEELVGRALSEGAHTVTSRMPIAASASPARCTQRSRSPSTTRASSTVNPG